MQPIPRVASSRRTVAGSLFFLLLIVGLTGCSSGPYAMQEGELADRHLPPEREVAHHPDSLEALSIVEQEEGQVQYELEQSYRSMVEKWSVRCRYGCGQNYATFRSLEVALASLQPEQGVLSLQPARAREIIQKRRTAYASTIQIDVYWYWTGTNISGPGYRIELHVADSTYHPVRKDYTPLRGTFTAGGRALYRRNTFHFPRVVDGVDLLENASSARLEIHKHGWRDFQFVWKWGKAQSLAQADGMEKQ